MSPSFPYRGLPVLQPPSVVGCFREFFRLERPDTIIEIGTARGGLALILNDLTVGVPIHTFDVSRAERLPSEPRIHFHVADVFSDGGRQAVERLIAAGGKVLLLCDGGNKVREFSTFAPALKPGDLVMAHDYQGRTCEWDWLEITDADVEEVSRQCALVRHHQPLMAQAAWLSCRKTAGADCA